MKGGKAVKQIKKYGVPIMIIGMLTLTTACVNEKSEYEKFKEDLGEVGKKTHEKVDEIGEEIFNKVFEVENQEE